jgi:cation:H+ antiporter
LISGLAVANRSSPCLTACLNLLATAVENTNAATPASPWFFAALFIGASFLMIWRLEAMSASGVENTALGTLIMPYCSGIGNLIFAFVVGRNGGSGAEVMTNALVNNVTNLTLLIGLPAVLWGMNLSAGSSKKKKKGAEKVRRINRLSMLLTLTAVLFFNGATWALASDGSLSFSDGLVLVGLFLFWQTFHVFEVLKSNVRKNKSFAWTLPFNLFLLAIGAYATYVSTDRLVDWISHIQTGFVSAKNLGWLSGWLMVVPNGLLAFYYGRRGNPEIVYTSQVGDGHICIPLCIGVFALFRTFVVPPEFQTGMLVLFIATSVHLICVALFGGLPRIVGWGLIAAYGFFLYKGLA